MSGVIVIREEKLEARSLSAQNNDDESAMVNYNDRSELGSPLRLNTEGKAQDQQHMNIRTES